MCRPVYVRSFKRWSYVRSRKVLTCLWIKYTNSTIRKFVWALNPEPRL
jgi:hypothetical protein